MKIKHLFLFSLLILSINFCYAQSSFHKVPKPHKSNGKLIAGAAVASTDNTVVKAFRFTGPIAGYMYPQNQVVTGLGYGWQRMHFVDSTQKYYTDFSISAVILAGGKVLPSIPKHNVISAGIGLATLNQLLMIIPCYNFPVSSSNKGSIGVVFSIAVPLNN